MELTRNAVSDPDARRPPRACVLVVDDDPGIRGFLEVTLRAEGYDVDIASDGRAALDCIGARRPDVVLLDLAMPVMNGWQVHDHLRDEGIDVPVVYMTAGYSARAEAEAHQADGYLEKPFNVDDLLRIVARLTPVDEGGSRQSGTGAAG